MVQQIAQSKGLRIETAMYAKGGYRLKNHASDSQLDALLQSEVWHIVVLQEQSQLPAFRSKQTRVDVFPYADQLVKKNRGINASAKIAFYQTMAHRNGDRENAQAFPELGTYRGMQERVNATYRSMALDHHGILIPVGELWITARQNNALQIPLYRDSVHPSKSGTYLAACIFIKTLFDQPVSGAWIPPGIKPQYGNTLQRLVDEHRQ
ncbi:MAG: DUF4886 domain-containing protein [Verrucomicrobiota bacterium]